MAELWQGPHQGLDWAVGWAGLYWAGHQKRGPRATPSKRGNAAARRPETGQKRTKNGAFARPRTMRLNRQRFGKAHTKAWAGLWAGLGCAGLGWAGHQKSGRRAYPSSTKTRPQSLPFKTGLGWLESAGLGWGWAGLGWAGLGWAGLGWAGLAGLGWAPKTRPQSLPFKTGKRSGTARPNSPTTDRKRSQPKTMRLNPVGWQGPHQGLDWAVGWAGLYWAGHQKRGPRATPSKRGNAAARRPKRAKNGPKTERSRGRERCV